VTVGGHESFSPPARLAAPGEGITVDEQRMAARNHGLPLEMLDVQRPNSPRDDAANVCPDLWSDQGFLGWAIGASIA
jgi:hypothetical protein